jgi:hypothetical protein
MLHAAQFSVYSISCKSLSVHNLRLALVPPQMAADVQIHFSSEAKFNIA